MMYLYQFNVRLVDDALTVIVVAKDEEKAFVTAEMEVEKHFLKLPKIKEITLIEKKPIRASGGFVCRNH